MDSDKENKVSQFCSITGANPDRAMFYLQASEWDIMLAVSTYFESDNPEEDSQAMSSNAAESQSTSASSQSESSQPGTSYTNPNSRIQTFSSWGSKPQKDDDEGEEGQAYYAGGSEESGQQILGPARNKKKGNVVEDLFKSAKEHGAQVVSESERHSKKSRNYFVGTGYRLGESETEPTQQVLGAVRSQQPVNIVLKLWKPGFTINDDPIRPYDDPSNRQFLDCIKKGETPPELLALGRGGEVTVDMEDHRHEDYEPPKQVKVKAFTGEGQTLGGPSSATVSDSSAVTSGSARLAVVDSSQPVTNVQIRLSDGSRLVSKFNHSHTVEDVRRHIVASRPQYTGVSFTLLTNLPSRQLTDDSVTLKQADLLNAVIIQKV